jgi:hypothetical protein
MASKTVDATPRILSFDEVRARLAKHWDVLAELPHVAFKKYKKRFASALAQPSSRFRSTTIHEIIVDEARRLFNSNVVKARGRWLLTAATDLVLQFKKVNARGRTSNIPTDAALQFATQLDLPGIPSGTRVTLGYRLNREGTEVLDVRLVATNGNVTIWNEEMTTNQMSVPVPMVAPKPAIAPPPRRLRAKPEVVEQVKKNKQSKE